MTNRPTKKMIGSRSTKELKIIINCRDTTELAKLVTKEKYKELLSITTTPQHEQHMVSFAQSLEASLKLFMFPVNVFMVGIGFISLLVNSAYLLPLTLSIIVIGIGLFGYGTYKSHKESKEKKQETKEFFELADLKLQAYNELIQRKREKIQALFPSASLNRSRNTWHKVYTPKNATDKSLMVLESIGAAITPAITLSIAAIAVGSAFQTIGVITMTAFVLTPLGAALATAIAFTGTALGLFVGIKNYHSSVNKSLVEAEEKKVKFLLNEQKKEYRTLEKKHLKLKIRYQALEDNEKMLKSAHIVNGKIYPFPSIRATHPGLRFHDLNIKQQESIRANEEQVAPPPSPERKQKIDGSRH